MKKDEIRNREQSKKQKEEHVIREVVCAFLFLNDKEETLKNEGKRETTKIVQGRMTYKKGRIKKHKKKTSCEQDVL